MINYDVICYYVLILVINFRCICAHPCPTVPEHVKEIRKLWNVDFEQTKKPILDEYEIEEIENKIRYAMELRRSITIKTWEEGFYKDYTGVVYKPDGLTKCIYLEEKDRYIKKISFNDVVQVEILDND